MPKCASTWLQRRYFLPRHGFESAIDFRTAHVSIVRSKPFSISDWDKVRQLFDFNTGDKVPVVSVEVLVGNPLTGGANGEANLSRLSRVVPEAKILLIIREQRAMVRSLYKTLVNFGSPLPIQTHLFNDLPGNFPAFEPSYLNYDGIIHAYQQTFGDDSVLVLPVEQLSADPQSFLHAISRFCEIDIQKYPIVADARHRENINWSLFTLELKRLHNLYVVKSRISPRGLYKPAWIDRKGFRNYPISKSIDRWLERRFAAQVTRMIDGLYADSNARTQRLTGLKLQHYGYQLP